MRKGNAGITLVSLVITIVIILILTTIIVTDTYTGSDYKKYKLMCADVEMLEEKILIYYNKYGDIPKLTQITEDLPEIAEDTGHDFYKVDISKLSGVTLNYGDTTDIFIIDNTTFEVYYLNGVEYDGVIYYTD